MKKIEDIKEFEDIDTYYEISKIVEEVFQDRVEAHKHLVTANKEIERLNNIIDELIEDIPCLLEIINRNEKDIKVYQDEWIAIKSVENKLQELKGSNKNV